MAYRDPSQAAAGDPGGGARGGSRAAGGVAGAGAPPPGPRPAAELDGDPSPRPAEPRGASQAGRAAPPGASSTASAAVREAVQQPRATVRTHLTHPFGASTTSRSSLEDVSQDETLHRGITRAPELISALATDTHVKLRAPRDAARRGRRTLGCLPRSGLRRGLSAPTMTGSRSCKPRLGESGTARWDDEVACPRWRMIEAWTIAAHGPHMAAAGGFRLAFWREEADRHGPRLERALARYGRYAEARPPGFPAARSRGSRTSSPTTSNVRTAPSAAWPTTSPASTSSPNRWPRTPTPPAPTTGSGPPPEPAGASAPASSPSRSISASSSACRRPAWGAAPRRLRAARQRLPGAQSRWRQAVRRRDARATARRARPAAARRRAPGQRGRPLPRRVHPRGAVGAFAAARTVGPAGRLAVAVASGRVRRSHEMRSRRPFHSHRRPCRGGLR